MVANLRMYVVEKHDAFCYSIFISTLNVDLCAIEVYLGEINLGLSYGEVHQSTSLVVYVLPSRYLSGCFRFVFFHFLSPFHCLYFLLYYTMSTSIRVKIYSFFWTIPMSLILLLLILFLAILAVVWHFLSADSPPSIRGDVLLVFAHPDDEAMFFSPLLHLLKSKGITTHFLCLSNGNFEGIGTIREAELHRSANFFGISNRNTKIINNEDLQDSMTAKWPPNVVEKEVERYLERAMNISTIITFDKFGVSQHPNHVACHEGVKRLKKKFPPGLIFLELKTHPLPCKYLGAGSLLLPSVSLFRQRPKSRTSFDVIIPPTSFLTCFKAMKMHASQLKWFRYLFIFFSSYSCRNAFSEIL